MRFVKLFEIFEIPLGTLLALTAINFVASSCKSDTYSINDPNVNQKKSFPVHELREGLWPEDGLASWERRVLFGDVIVVEGLIAMNPELSGPFDFREINGLNSIVHVRHGNLRASKVIYCDIYTLIDGRLVAIQDGPVEFPCFSRVQMSEVSKVGVELTLQKLEGGDKGVFVLAFNEFLVSYELVKIIDEDSKKRLVQILERKIESQQHWNSKVSRLDFSDLFCSDIDIDD